VILASFLLITGVWLATASKSSDNTKVATASNAHIITSGGGGGSGTLSDPYRIASQENLRDRRTQLESQTHHHFILVGTIGASITFNNVGGSIGNFIFRNNTFDGQLLDNGNPAFTIVNLNVSLFNTVEGTGSVIRNINFSGNGNIANNWNDATMRNVHHLSGTVSNASQNIGGLVNHSHNGTFINSSNRAAVTRTVGTAANMVNVNGGLIGRSTGSLTMTRCFNTGAVSAAVGNSAEVSGGLVGRIDSTQESLIEHSWNEGTINGIRSAGFVGRKGSLGNAGTLTIRESRNGSPNNPALGSVNNHTGQSAAAGFLAWMHLGTVHIQSSINYGTVTSSGMSASGFFSTRIGGYCFVNNSLNLGQVLVGISNTAHAPSSLNNVTCAESATSNIGIGIRATEAQLRHPNILGTLGPAFAMGMNGLPVLREFSPTVLFFHNNGGLLKNIAAPVIEQPSGPLTVAGAQFLATPTRVGHQFRGWHTSPALAPGETAPMFPVTSPAVLMFDGNLLTNKSQSYFAIWEVISYRVRTIGMTERDQRWQLLNAETGDGIGLPVTSGETISSAAIIIGANLTLRTGLDDVTMPHYFTKWEILFHEGADTWHDRGAGQTPETSAFFEFEQQYNFTINENFIRSFARWDSDLEEWYFVFKATYVWDALPSSITLDAGAASQRAMGTMKVDGVEFTRLHRINVTTAEIAVAAKPNDYFEFVMFRTRIDGGTWVEYERHDDMLHAGSGEYRLSLPADNGREVRIVFAAEPINISVKARVQGGDDIDDGNNGWASGLFQNNGAPDSVSLQFGRNAFQGVSILSTPGYRLVNRSIRNIKIRNFESTGPEDEYTYFSAINGRININNMDADFFDRHIDPANKAQGIVIIALFYEQVMVQISIIDDIGLGDFLVTVVDKSNIRHRLAGPSGMGFFDKESEVTVHAFPFGDATIKRIMIIQGVIEINTYQFTLDGATHITIEFERADYNLSVTARDIHGSPIDEGEFPGISHLDIQMSVEEFSGFQVWDRESGFGLHHYLRLSIDNLWDFEDEWSFLGWFAVLCGSGDLDLISMSHTVTLDNTYYFPKYLDDKSCCGPGHSDTLTIVARFARITTVVFRVDEENGAHETKVINEADGGLRRDGDIYNTGTIIELRFKPAAFFTYQITGLEKDEKIEEMTIGGGIWYIVNIFVGEARVITLEFKPMRREVTDANAIVSNGTVTVSRQDLGIGDTITITFNPDFGYRRSEWTINGETIEQMRALGTNARVSRDRNTLTFTVSEQWMAKWQGTLNYVVTADLDPMVFVGAGAGGVAIIALLIGMVFMIRANQKRKADYRLAQEKAREAKARMGHADLIQKLREGEQ